MVGGVAGHWCTATFRAHRRAQASGSETLSLCRCIAVRATYHVLITPILIPMNSTTNSSTISDTRESVISVRDDVDGDAPTFPPLAPFNGVDPFSSASASRSTSDARCVLTDSMSVGTERDEWKLVHIQLSAGCHKHKRAVKPLVHAEATRTPRKPVWMRG